MNAMGIPTRKDENRRAVEHETAGDKRFPFAGTRTKASASVSCSPDLLFTCSIFRPMAEKSGREALTVNHERMTGLLARAKHREAWCWRSRGKREASTTSRRKKAIGDPGQSPRSSLQVGLHRPVRSGGPSPLPVRRASSRSLHRISMAGGAAQQKRPSGKPMNRPEQASSRR
jgi:hypothetical protein